MKKLFMTVLCMAFFLCGCSTNIQNDTAEAVVETDVELHTEQPAAPTPSTPIIEGTESPKAETLEIDLTEEDREFFTAFLREKGNWCCIVSEYENPSRLDPDDVFYSGIPGSSSVSYSLLSKDEQQAVKTAFYLTPVMENKTSQQQCELWEHKIMLDMVKLTFEQVDGFLTEKFGLTLSELENGFSDFAAAEEYGAYYNFVGDTNYFLFELTGGYYEDENTVVLTYRKTEWPEADMVVTLKRSGDSWQFVSNLPSESYLKDIEWQEPPYTQSIITNGEMVRSLPDVESEQILVRSFTYVDISASAIIDGVLWMHVCLPVWEAFQPEMGWVPADCMVQYTEQNREQIMAPLTLADDAAVYNENIGAAQDTSFVGKIFVETRTAETKRLPTSADDYVCIGSIGGWTGVVNKALLVYPELRENYELIVVDGSIAYSNFDNAQKIIPELTVDVYPGDSDNVLQMKLDVIHGPLADQWEVLYDNEYDFTALYGFEPTTETEAHTAWRQELTEKFTVDPDDFGIDGCIVMDISFLTRKSDSAEFAIVKMQEYESLRFEMVEIK